MINIMMINNINLKKRYKRIKKIRKIISKIINLLIKNKIKAYKKKLIRKKYFLISKEQIKITF